MCFAHVEAKRNLNTAAALCSGAMGNCNSKLRYSKLSMQKNRLHLIAKCSRFSYKVSHCYFSKKV